ncbi:ketopantoate reductase PanE/ApbA-domain-containing protein [Aspergillus karnatakaensis]|uniref:ketopantoate reductase family protein n=1 Tax=Aspergillus karnatakaensis TaxID=1810916 RepID=UPI003CCD7F90
MSQEINVLLYGLGAIGSFYAFILNRCDRVRLTVVARSNYDAVVKDGIFIDSKNHGQHRFHPDHGTTPLAFSPLYQTTPTHTDLIRSPSEASTKFDYVVCAHKAVDPAGAITPLDPVIHEQATIVVLQNGVGNEDPFRARWPAVTILSGVVWVGAAQPTPGNITHTGSELTELGLFPNPTLDAKLEQTRLETFTTLLTAGGTNIKVFDDIQPRRWEKVVWNAAWNPITTLTDQDVASWLSSSADAVDYTRRIMGEVIAVAAAVGVELREGLVEELLERVNGLGALRTSMQADREGGRGMEVEVILGTPVRRGRELGVDVSGIEGLYVLLTALNRKILGRTQ